MSFTKVNDYDLYALLYAGKEDEDGNAKFTPEEAAQAAEEANGRVKNTDSSSENSQTAAESENGENDNVSSENKVPTNINSIYLIGAVVLVGLAAVGFIAVKKKQNKNGERKAEFDPYEYNSEDDELDIFDGDGNFDDE